MDRAVRLASTWFVTGQPLICRRDGVSFEDDLS